MLSLLFVIGCTSGAEPEGAAAQAPGLHLPARKLPPLPGPDAQLEAVTGFDGLAGSYIRVPYLAPQGELLSLDVSVYIAEGGGAQGPFSLLTSELCYYPGCNADVGDYNATPQNPAIGFAYIMFNVRNLDGTVSHDSYVVDAAARNKAGDITYLKLRHVVGNSFGTPFFLARTL
jgi:hypothetical protein